MCIGTWTLEDPDYALILCTNRDEFLHRPTQDAHFHSFQDDLPPQHPSSVSGNVLSGRDIQAGGSWFGLSRTGKVALLTNITEPPKSFSSSRGHLVSSFLLSDSSHPLEDEVGKIISPEAKFAGFNLLLLAPTPPSASRVPKETGIPEKRVQGLEPKIEEATVNSREQKLYYDAMLVTNHGAGGHLEARRLSPAERGCGCISNGIDGQGGSDWPKVRKLGQSLKETLQISTMDSLPFTKESELVQNLFDILTWQSPDPVTERGQLRNTVQVTPIPVLIYPNGASSFTSGRFSTPVIDTPPSDPTVTSNSVPLSATPGFKGYYGTRLSTVLLIRRDGSVLFIERDVWRLCLDGQPEKLNCHENGGGGDAKERVFKFQLDWK